MSAKTINKCASCGYIFNDNQIYSSSGDNYPSSQDYDACPRCLSDFVKMYQCTICGNYDEYADDGYCDNCKVRVVDKLMKFISDNYTTEEKILMREIQRFEGLIDWDSFLEGS